MLIFLTLTWVSQWCGRGGGRHMYGNGVTCSARLHNNIRSRGITQVCRVAYMHLNNVRKIRTMLTDEAVSQLKHAFITSRIELFHRPCLCYQLQSIEQNMYVLL